MPITSIYPDFAVQDTYVNLDIGLIEIDDVSRWTTKVPGIGIPGPMAEFSGANLSLSLVGRHVRGVGAASGVMLGEIQGLFYRYKTGGGFEYVSDLFIGPRSRQKRERKNPAAPKFATHLAILERSVLEPGNVSMAAEHDEKYAFLPLAMEWGRNMLASTGNAARKFCIGDFVVAVCALLEVDPIRDWNLDQPDTWGRWVTSDRNARARCAIRQISAPRQADGQQRGNHQSQ